MTSAIEALHSRLIRALTYREPISVIESLVNENPAVLEWQDDNDEGRTPLHYVLRRGPFDMIPFFVQKCPRALEIANYDRETPLHVALQANGPEEIILLLIKSNTKSLEMVDKFKRTPLHICCCSYTDVENLNEKCVEIVRLLLDLFPQAAKMRDRDGNTPLHYACFCSFANYLPKIRNNVAMIQLLMKCYPQAAHMQNNDGNTPLHRAAPHNPNIEVLRYLVAQWPIACLVCNYTEGENIVVDAEDNSDVEVRLNVCPSQLPVEKAKAYLCGVGALEVCNFLTQTTIDTTYGLIDATLHSLSALPPVVPYLIQQYLSSNEAAAAAAVTIQAGANVGIETRDLLLPAVKELVKKNAFQTMLKDEKIASFINGFIRMNKSGRKEALKDGANILLGIAVCASASANASCLFMHLRENLLLCMRRQASCPEGRDVLKRRCRRPKSVAVKSVAASFETTQERGGGTTTGRGRFRHGITVVKFDICSLLWL